MINPTAPVSRPFSPSHLTSVAVVSSQILFWVCGLLYLDPHIAIQGTTRPVHYHLIINKLEISVNRLQKIIYHQYHQYIRSTTPVSLYPAIYYAHLAAARPHTHKDIHASDKDPQNKADEIRMGQVRLHQIYRQQQEAGKAPWLLDIGADRNG